MARWRPGAAERLQAAALARIAEQGFERTTVAEIATAAGLTVRTFFRHFTDKREVLFHGQERLEEMFVAGVVEAPDGEPMALVAAALDRAAAFFADDRRPLSRARQAIIDADPGLRERELLKLSALSTAITAALGRRGIDPTAAALLAESGVAVFRISFAQWIAQDERRPLAEIQVDVLATLRDLAGTGPARPSPPRPG